MLYTTNGKPINPRDFFELKVYSLKMSKEFQELTNTTEEGGAANDDGNYSNYANNMLEVTKQLISTADLLQIGQVEDTIYLPIPNSIEESISHNYMEDPLDIGEIVKSTALSATKMLAPLWKLTDKKDANGALRERRVVTTIRKMDIVKNLTEFAHTMMGRSNIILDPRLLLVYKSTNPRSFTFNFILMPQNENDSAYFKKIVDLLKSYSKAEEKKMLGFLPILKQDKIFSFNFGGLDNMNSLINELMRTDDAESKTPGFFISSIDLTVNNDLGYVKTYHDGMPIQMNLSIKFEERKPLFFKFWNAKTPKATQEGSNG